MAQIIVRNLENDVRDRLRDQAQRHGRSMEEQVREILRAATAPTPQANGLGLGSQIAQIFRDEVICDEPFELSRWPESPAEPMSFDE